jgi:hypothetical protein
MIALATQVWIMGGMNYHPNSGSFKAGQHTKQIAGMKFGRLSVLSRAGNDKHGSAMWNCVCDCGVTGVFKGRNLTIGKTKSCGCWLLEQRRSPKKHGHTSRTLGATSEYSAWKAMRQRCENPNNRSWKDYGGRGITVCDRWHTFSNFLQDMGKKPSPNLSIERVENNSGYTKENCIWATKRVQNRNKRNNIILTHNGKSQTIKDWANEYGLLFGTLYFRILRGWPMEKALTPPQEQFRHKRKAT